MPPGVSNAGHAEAKCIARIPPRRFCVYQDRRRGLVSAPSSMSIHSPQQWRREAHHRHVGSGARAPNSRLPETGKGGDARVPATRAKKARGVESDAGNDVGSYAVQWQAMRQACRRRQLEHRALRALEGRRGGVNAFRHVLRGRGGADRELIDRLLYCVAERGDVAAARLLLQREADVKGTPLARPLFGAIESGNLALVRLLLRHGAPLGPDPIWGTPLSWAVFNGHAAIVRELLTRGANPDAPIRYDTTIPPLVVALLRAQHCVGLLLHAGAAATAVFRERKGQGFWRARRANGERFAPIDCDLLSIAEATGNAAAIRLLRRSGAKPAAHPHGGNRGHALQVDALAEPTRRGMTLLRRGAGLAAIRRVVTRAEQLKGPNTRDDLLALACKRRRGEVVRYFLKLGARPTGSFEALAELAGGSLPIMRALLDAGYGRADGELFSALVSAIRGGHSRLVRLLLDRGAKVVAGPRPWLKAGCEKREPTALMEAVACDATRCVELLLARGADPDRGCDGFPPVENGRLPVDAFIRGCYSSRGIVPTHPERHSGGPLHVAVVAGNIRLFRLLLRLGANPDAQPGLGTYVASLRPEPLRRRFEALLEARRVAASEHRVLSTVTTESARGVRR